jgi:hypothetical protein
MKLAATRPHHFFESTADFLFEDLLFFSTRLPPRSLAVQQTDMMAGDFFELFKNACNFFCARRTAYWFL